MYVFMTPLYFDRGAEYKTKSLLRQFHTKHIDIFPLKTMQTTLYKRSTVYRIYDCRYTFDCILYKIINLLPVLPPSQNLNYFFHCITKKYFYARIACVINEKTGRLIAHGLLVQIFCSILLYSMLRVSAEGVGLIWADELLMCLDKTHEH